MWIPHNQLGPLRADSDRDAIRASDAAKEERAFVVGFVLCNTLTKSWETDLLVTPNDHRREISIDGKPATVYASGNVAGKLHEIIYTVPATGSEHALATAYGHVVGELNRMALQYGRSFELAGWRVADVEFNARWRFAPFRPSALMPAPDQGPLPAAYAEALQLYREARSASSPAWRLIAAGAILDAAVCRRAPFDKVSRDFANFPLTTNMLVQSGTLVTHPELKGGTAILLRDIAEVTRQAFITQLVALGGDTRAPDLRDFNCATSLVALANLVDLVAHDILVESLRAEGHMRPVEDAATADNAATPEMANA